MSLGLGFSLPAYFLSSGAFAGASLNLDFTSGNQTLDPRITFSRTSNATLTNSDGLIAYAPHNLLTYSEQFDNAQWVKGASCVVTANAATAPDGTSTADFVVSSGATAGANTIRNLQTTADPNGSTYVFSVWLRADAPTTTTIRCANAADGDGSQQTVNVGTTWERFSVSRTFTATSTGVRGAINYQSSAVSVYAWGAQLNVGALQPYYPTTVKNLLGYTQEFDNPAWTKTNATVTANATTAPDGSMTADKLVESATTAGFNVQRVTAGTVNTSAYTFSLYAKASERSEVRLRVVEGSTFGRASLCFFDLAAGTAGSVSNNAGAVGSASIINLGNGWYRCSISVTLGGTDTSILTQANLASGGNTTYTGDGTSGIFIWGAQLSDSASLDQYVYNPGAAPSAAAYYGPRFDYDPVTLAPKGLLIEEQRTNSIRNNTMQGAVAGTPGTLPTNWDGIGNAQGLTRTILGVGTESGVTYIDIRWQGTLTSTLSGTIFAVAEPTTGVVAANGQTWTGTWFVRLVGGSLTNLSNLNCQITERTAAGVFIVSSSTPISPTDAALIQQRYAITRTLSGGVTTERITSEIRANAASGVTLDFTLRIGMPQLEQGAFATSVIPTTTAAVTRAADVATMIGANFSNWYNQSEGTLFVDAIEKPDTATRIFASITDGTTEGYAVATFSNTGRIRAQNVSSSGIGTTVTGQPFKIGYSFESGAQSGSLNGSAIVTTATTVTVVPTMIRIGSNQTATAFWNSTVRRIAYYNRRLANTELQGITS